MNLQTQNMNKIITAYYDFAPILDQVLLKSSEWNTLNNHKMDIFCDMIFLMFMAGLFPGTQKEQEQEILRVLRDLVKAEKLTKTKEKQV